MVSYEAIRLWCNKFGSTYARRLKRKHQGYGDTFFIDDDEVFIKINGKQHYLWRAVDQDGEVVDVYLQKNRDGVAAKRFFNRLIRKHGGEPGKIVTDKLRSYGVPDGDFGNTEGIFLTSSTHNFSESATITVAVSAPETALIFALSVVTMLRRRMQHLATRAVRRTP